jgi:hypothetical protein
MVFSCLDLSADFDVTIIYFKISGNGCDRTWDLYVVSNKICMKNYNTYLSRVQASHKTYSSRGSLMDPKRRYHYAVDWLARLSLVFMLFMIIITIISLSGK